MNRRHRSRTRQRQINILHTTTRKKHSQKQVVHLAVWSSIVLGMIIVVGIGMHIGVNVLLSRVLYTNPQYSLNEIEIQPRGHFSEKIIRQSAGLEMGQNLWTLNLRQIAHDLEKLPYVSNAKVERHFPDKITILIHERVPVVKIVGLSSDLGTRELYYIDRDCIILKPREDEEARSLPEIIGLTNAEIEPGSKLDEPGLTAALQILDAIDHTPLHTLIDIRTIDLKDPLSITMTTTQDMAITFRLDCIDQQLVRLKQAFDFANGLQHSLRTIDLTPDYNVPVTFNQ